MRENTMTGKKIGRRALFRLLPGGIVAAVAGVTAAVAAGDETVEMTLEEWDTTPLKVSIGVESVDVAGYSNFEVEVDYEQLAQALLDAPLEDVSVERGKIIGAVDEGAAWIFGEEDNCPDCTRVCTGVVRRTSRNCLAL